MFKKWFGKKQQIEDDESELSDGLLEKTWGSVQTLVEDVPNNIEFRKIVVTPGKHTSLHKHLERREYWYVASGIGEVEVANSPEWGRERHVINKGQEIVITIGKWHRLINTSETKDLVIYELAIGNISEDDIERLKEEE